MIVNSKNDKKEMPIIVKVLIGVAIVIIILLYIVVYESSTIYEPKEGYYYLGEANGTEMYLHIYNFKTETLYVNYSDFMVGKVCNQSEWTFWNHLIGKIYFKEKSVLSISFAPADCQPATLRTKCTGSYYCQSDYKVKEYKEAAGQIDVSEVLFYDDYIMLDGVAYDRIDPGSDKVRVVKELVRLYIESALKEN